MFPSPRLLPPVTERLGGTAPRCMGGCGSLTEKGRRTCTTCWLHLPDRLRGQLRRWIRLDTCTRSTVILEVEAACRSARRRAR